MLGQNISNIKEQLNKTCFKQTKKNLHQTSEAAAVLVLQEKSWLSQAVP